MVVAVHQGKGEDSEMMEPAEAAPNRELHGFSRTTCGCEICRVPCRHVPGGLDPADLPRLCPPGQDLLAWAEEHLRALTDKPFPTLVPARQASGACHWLFDERCAVHDQAPYGCAFFDTHMSKPEADQRYRATVEARKQDAASEGLYYRVWRHLRQRGLIGRPGDRAAMNEEMSRLCRTADRRWHTLPLIASSREPDRA